MLDFEFGSNDMGKLNELLLLFVVHGDADVANDGLAYFFSDAFRLANLHGASGGILGCLDSYEHGFGF